jgi:rubrerythrin
MTALAAAPKQDLEVELERDRYICATCAYGISVLRLPERCPMCGDEDWTPEPRRS